MAKGWNVSCSSWHACHLALVIIATAACSVGDSGPSRSQWVSAVATQGEDQVACIAVDASGHIHATGTIAGHDLFLREYGSDGALLLEKTWPSSGAWASGLTAVPSGGVVLSFEVRCGPTSCLGPDLGAGPAQGAAIARLDAMGALVWQLDTGVRDAQGIGSRPTYERPSAKPNGNIVVEGDDASGSFIAQLSPDGRELWRWPKGNLHGWGATVVVDGAGTVTALDVRDLHPVVLVRYDDAGNTVWQVQPSVGSMSGSLALMGDSRVALVTDRTLGIVRSADGALERAIDLPSELWNGFPTADASQIAVIGTTNTSGCAYAQPRIVTYDLAGAVVSDTTFARGCGAPWVYSAATAPDGGIVMGGSFNVPFDFGTGTDLAPRGSDGFVVYLPR